MSLIGKLKGFTDVLAWLSKLNPADLPKLLEAFQVVSDPTAELRDRIKACLVVADVATDYIPGEADDALVDAIAHLLDCDDAWLLVEVIETLLTNGGRVKDLQLMQMAHPDGLKLGKGDDAKAVPWPLIIKIALTIISLLAEFSDKPLDKADEAKVNAE